MYGLHVGSKEGASVPTRVTMQALETQSRTSTDCPGRIHNCLLKMELAHPKKNWKFGEVGCKNN